MLPLLACCLTVAASGDDFDFVRLVFPSLYAAEAYVPQDDPTMDFEAAATEGSRLSEPGSFDEAGSFAFLLAAARAARPSFAHPLHVAFPISQPCACIELTLPLLC